MAKQDNDQFLLTYDPNYSLKWPHGYWYAVSARGDYDASGATPTDALAGLVIQLDQARLESE